MDGVLVVDKPEGWTSFDVVVRIRFLSGERRVGHAGSLDPWAQGIIVVCVGWATRIVRFIQELEKVYIAEVALGSVTDTDDATGTVVSTAELPHLDSDRLAAVMEAFTGEIEQVPPTYSALKHKGERLYRLARQGRPVIKEPRKITIYSLRLLDSGTDSFRFEVRCSKGTYIRALARDMGRWLGCGAHLRWLRRTSIGPFNEECSVALGNLSSREDVARALRPWCEGVAHLPSVRVGSKDLRRLQHGVPVALSEVSVHPDGTDVRVEDVSGRVVGVARMRVEGEHVTLVHPRLLRRGEDR